MAERRAFLYRGGGELFRFYADPDTPAVLHITRRHGTAPEDAVRAFFDGVTQWNPDHARFETETDTHVVYWARHGHDGSVVVITCFGREEAEQSNGQGQV